MRKLTYILLLFSGLVSCTNETIIPKLKGELLGFVELIDVNGEKYYDLDSVNVSVGESDYNGVSDENGRFIVKDIIPGTYNITLHSDSFGLKKIYNIPIIGGDEPYFFKNKITIYEQPKINVKFVSVNTEDKIINVEIILDTLIRGDFTAYWSGSPEITSNKYIHSTPVNSWYYSNKNSISCSFSPSNAPETLAYAENIYFLVTVKNSFEKISTFNQETEKNEYHSEVAIMKSMKVE